MDDHIGNDGRVVYNVGKVYNNSKTEKSTIAINELWEYVYERGDLNV